MIRFLLDIQTYDIIVLTEKSVKTVGFYYVADFLKIEKDNNAYNLSIREIFEKLLKYWKGILEEDYDEIFLIYELSDEYVSAFCIEKFNFKGRMYKRVTKKYTLQLSGWVVTIDTTNEELRQVKWEQRESFQLQCSAKTIMKGMDWSIENLRLNTNPINME
jgi:hypothetical protein